MTLINAFTIDVEDYFHIHAFSRAIDPSKWDSFDQRVERNTYRILDILDSIETKNIEYRLQKTASGREVQLTNDNAQRNTDHGLRPTAAGQLTIPNGLQTSVDEQSVTPYMQTKKSPTATFFVLGWVAQRFPSLVKEIHKRGHEVACHGMNHTVIFRQNRAEFEEDVRRAKGILADITGAAVLGYRAPTYSITKKTLWALEVLMALGFQYDSSIFPVRHDYYGFPDAPRFPFLVHANGDGVHFRNLDQEDIKSKAGEKQRNSIIEYPLTTSNLFGLNIPIAGGGYFRLFPYSLTRFLLSRVNRKENRPFIFYFHPWEIDPEVPRIESAGTVSRFRSSVNLDKTEVRLKRLLKEFSFSSLISSHNQRITERGEI